MARVIIPIPETFPFFTDLDVYIQHINAGQHLANEQLVALLNEARMRYLATLPLQANDIEPRGFIGADLAVIYQSEVRYGDRLRIEVAADDFNKYGCDFVYRVTSLNNAQPVAIAKMAMLMFDYTNQRLKPVPEGFKALFSGSRS